MHYKNKVKALREARGWSQRDLAARLNVMPATVAQWETGVNGLSLKNAVALADLFGCTLDAVLGREPPAGTSA